MNPAPDEKIWTRCAHCHTLELAHPTEFHARHSECDPVAYPTIANRFLALKNLFTQHLDLDPSDIEITTTRKNTKIVFWFKDKRGDTTTLTQTTNPKTRKNKVRE
ncbi:MAG: hypothetical protein Q7R47_04170 [Candidatus Diapherotrites archaeon]|nr:hypothetical protein [Candidatus Diapherotrites archaeon]